MSDRLAEIRARLDAVTEGKFDTRPDFFAHAAADIAWLLREIEKWQHVAKSDLYGVCWCDAPRHDCCGCPGVNDDA